MYGSTATNGAERIELYHTPFAGEIGLGAQEISGSEGHIVVREGIFGIWAEVRGPAGTARKVTYPVFSGMSYVSACYEGGFTPRVVSQRNITSIQRVGDGIWRFVNHEKVEFRIYALNMAGQFVNSSFDFDSAGVMSRPLEGWLRLARVTHQADASVLDAHAGAILTGVELEVEAGGTVRYVFEKSGDRSVPILHHAYQHHLSLLSNTSQAVTSIAPIRGPTKGDMRAVAGDSWELVVDLSEVSGLDFLPRGEPGAERWDFLAAEALGTLQWFNENCNWKSTMFKTSYYFSGKGFQKVAMVCLLVERFYGANSSHAESCAGILEAGFRCLYDPSYSGDCFGAPGGAFYDEDWGGIPSKDGYFTEACMGSADFGNACYNDHHYHYGYYVVTASVLAKLRPWLLDDAAFVAYVETLIRDTTNPSSEDAYFPRFRSFDWFDLHSWSRGVVPSADGKDQESTSEELNLLYGIHLWGTATGNAALRDLGQTMLALCATTIQEFFLLETGNPHHPEDFVKNHVTGIFFQNKVHYTTWFGWDEKFIHGIQMLPLSPALQITRRASFCRQEWDDVLLGLPMAPWDPWTSILLTGNLAFFDPDEAYNRLRAMDPGHMDDGLTRVWALYWVATSPGAFWNNSAGSHAPALGDGASGGQPTTVATLAPVPTAAPQTQVAETAAPAPTDPPVSSATPASGGHTTTHSQAATGPVLAPLETTETPDEEAGATVSRAPPTSSPGPAGLLAVLVVVALSVNSGGMA